jgi:hypothetical protein
MNYTKSTDLSPEKRAKRNKIARESYLRNKEKKLDYMKKHYNENPSLKKAYYESHKSNISEVHRKYHINQYKESIHFKVKTSLRNMINECLRKGIRIPAAEYVLGCNIDFFRDYLESLFLPGMSWANRSEWHIDHITPAKNFDLSILADIKKCFTYGNFRPLWKVDNLRKSAKPKTTACRI